jgi:hypothetical protein
MGRLLSLPTRPVRHFDLNRGQGQAQGRDSCGRCRTGILDQATGTAALPLSPIDVDRVLRRRSYAFTPVSSRRSSRGRRATASSRCRRPPDRPAINLHPRVGTGSLFSGSGLPQSGNGHGGCSSGSVTRPQRTRSTNANPFGTHGHRSTRPQCCRSGRAPVTPGPRPGACPSAAAATAHAPA